MDNMLALLLVFLHMDGWADGRDVKLQNFQ